MADIFSNPAMAALAVGVIALAGVLVTNLVTLVVQWLQRRHDAAQKRIEREFGVKREVYLVSVELLKRAVGAFAHLPTGNWDEITKDVANAAGAMSKLQLVGSATTSALALRIGTKLAVWQMELAREALPIKQLQGRAETHLRLIAKEQAEGDRLVEAMRFHNESRSQDATKFAVLNESFSCCQQRNAQLRNEHDAMLQQQGELMRAYYTKLFDIIENEARPLDGNLLDSLRADLGLPQRTEEERKLLDGIRPLMQKGMDGLIDMARRPLEPPMASASDDKTGST